MIFTDIEKSKILLFWVLVEVEGLSCASPSAMELKKKFLRRAAEKYDIYLKNDLYETDGVFAVPFKDKENIRDRGRISRRSSADGVANAEYQHIIIAPFER